MRRGASPERRCIVSGRSQPVGELVRFVIDPDNRVVPDVAGKLPGRGIWVHADRGSLETAVRKRLFSKAAKHAVIADDALADQVADLLVRSCLGLLGLARRAGLVVAGFDQVTALLDAGEAGVVLTAGDAAENGRKKIGAKLRQKDGQIANIEAFDRRELSLALGRENVVHAALRSGGLTTKFAAECKRLAGFRASGPEVVENQPAGGQSTG